MFEILRSVDKDVAIEAVYLAGLRMYERQFYPEWRKWLLLRPQPRCYAAVEVATLLIQQIEARSGRSLAELSDSELHPFHASIDERMAGRLGPYSAAQTARAARILAEMRRDYGSPVRNVAA